jgi:hypothetical protein
MSRLTPAQRADTTIWWGDSLHDFWWGGRWPLIWPALTLLSSLPLLVAAMRQRAVMRSWSWLGLPGLLYVALGFANVLLTELAISLSYLVGLEFSADGGTMAIALSGYALLFLGILALMVLARATPSAPASTRSTPPAGR